MADASALTLYQDEAPQQYGSADTLTVLLLLAALFAAGLGVGTQVAAWRLGFSPDLIGGAAPADPERARLLSSVGLTLLALGALALLLSPFAKRLAGLARRSVFGAALLLSALGGAFWAYGLPWLYAPYRLAHWAYAYAEVPPLTPYIAEGAGAGLLFIVAAGAGLRALSGPGQWKTSTRFGSARWGDGSWLARGARGGKVSHLARLAGYLFPSQSKSRDDTEWGFPLGYLPGKNELLYDRSGAHIFVWAPTGGGKTVGFSIPALLLHRGSVLAFDVKRELYYTTARRRAELGSDVYRLDPFGDQSAAYNPLDLIDTRAGHDLLAMDDARMVAEMCVVATGKETNPFFIKAARSLVLTVTLTHAYGHKRFLTSDGGDLLLGAEGVPLPNPERTLPAVRRTLMRADLQKHLEEIALDDRRDPETGAFIYPQATRDLAAQFAYMNEKTYKDVLITAREETSFLDSAAMERVLGASTLSFADLKEKTASIYLVLPPDRLNEYRGWARLMISCAHREILRSKAKRPRNSILFLLDEFARLGRFDEIDTGISLYRYTGIQYVLIVQTLAQLKDLYQEGAKNFTANPQNRIVWGVADEDAAEYVSRMSGETTVAVESASTTRSRSKGKSGRGMNKGVSSSTQERSRKLVTAGEALTLLDTHAFVFSRGQYPLVLRRPNYLSDPQFERLADPHPDYASAADVEAARQRRVELGIEAPRREPATSFPYSGACPGEGAPPTSSSPAGSLEQARTANPEGETPERQSPYESDLHL